MDGRSESGDSNIGKAESPKASGSSNTDSGLTETPVIDRIPRLGLIKKSKKRKPPRQTIQAPRTQILLPKTRKGWLKVGGVVAGGIALIASALVGIRLISDTGCSEFTTEVTNVAAGGLTINVLPGDLVGSYGVKLGVVPQAEFGPQSKNADAQAAALAIPQNLTPLGNFVTVRTCSVDPKTITLRMIAPPEAQTLDGFDLYGWDTQSRVWEWLGGEVDAQTREIVAHSRTTPSALMLMKTANPQSILSVDAPVKRGPATTWASRVPQNAAEASVPSMVVGDLGGLTIDSGGLPQTGSIGARVVPVARNWGETGEVNRTLVRLMLADPRARETHIAQLMNSLDVMGYDGLEIDYRGVAPTQEVEFVEFVEGLARKLGERGKQLTVVVPAPMFNATGIASMPGYDLRRIGEAAAQVKLDLSANPAVLMSDRLGQAVNWVTGRVNRYKLQVVVPTQGLRQDANGRTSMISLDDALAGLGPMGVVPAAARPGSTVQLKWRSGISPASTNYDPATHSYSYSYLDERGIQQTVWLGTSASLKSILQRLGQHNVRGITLRGLLTEGNDEGVVQVIDGYMRGNLASVPAPDPKVKVAFGTGTPFSVPLDGSTMTVQAPGGEGTYTLQSVFESGRQVQVGRISIQISKDAPLSAGGANTVTASAAMSSTNTTSGTVQSSELPQTAAAATAMPGVDADVFELGGAVNDVTHITQMQGAGMTWVKTDSRGFDVPTEFIATAKARGMKVMVTATGDRARVMDEGYRNEWTQHLGRLAALGVDAVEVWNQPNYEGDWPTGQINGATYADLLKRAYFAIKQANPNTLVISAALAQTSGSYSGGCDEKGCDELAFLSQMVTAGAQEVMDCVGVQYTSGHEAPSVAGGNHYSWYYEPLRNAYYGAFNGTKPVCFTALGYVSAQGFEGGMPTNYSFATATTLEKHAAWLAESATMSRRSGKVRLMIVWNVDSAVWRGGDDGDPQAGYAMIRPDGTCPACESLRTAMASEPQP